VKWLCEAKADVECTDEVRMMGVVCCACEITERVVVWFTCVTNGSGECVIML